MTQEELLLKLSVSMTGMKEVIRDYEKLIEGTKKTQTAIEKLGTEYSNMVKVNKLLHNGVTDTKTKMNMLETTIKSLIANGIKPASKEVQSLTNQYKKLQEQQSKAGKDSGFFDDIVKGIVGANIGMAIFNKTVQAVIFTLKTGFDFNRMMESSQMALGVMFRSQETAISLIGQFKTLSAQTGISLQDASEGAKQLSAYGFGAEDLVDNMKMLGTVSKAVGTSLGDLTYVYGTLRSQGRAYTRDLMQFAMRGIPIYEELGAVLGVDGSQIKKMAEDGKIGFKEVEKAFKNMTGEGGKFAGMLEKAMDTMDGKLAKLDNNFKQFSGNITKSWTDPIVRGFADVTNSFLESRNKTVEGSELVKTASKALYKEYLAIGDVIKQNAVIQEAYNVQNKGASKQFIDDVNNENLVLSDQTEQYRQLIIKARELQGLKENGTKQSTILPFTAKDVTALASTITKDQQVSTTKKMVNGKEYLIKDSAEIRRREEQNAKLLEVTQAGMEAMIKGASQGGADLNKVASLIQAKYDLTWQQAVMAVSVTNNLTKNEYDEMIANASQFSVDWIDIIEKFSKDGSGLMQTMASDASNSVRGSIDAFNSITRAGFNNTTDYMKAQSDQAEILIEKLKGDLRAVNETTVTGDNVEKKNAYMKELNKLIDFYEQYLKKTGSSSAVVADNFWQQYITNRKNVDTTLEGLAIQQKLVSVIGQQLTGDAGLDAINLKYAIQRKEVEKITDEEERKLRLLALQNEQLAEQKKTYEDIYNKAKASKGGRTEAQGKIEEEAGKQIQLLQKAMQDVLDNKDSTAEDKTKAQWGAGMKIQAIINKAEFDKIIAGSEIPMMIEGMKMLGFAIRDYTKAISDSPLGKAIVGIVAGLGKGITDIGQWIANSDVGKGVSNWAGGVAKGAGEMANRAGAWIATQDPRTEEEKATDTKKIALMSSFFGGIGSSIMTLIQPVIDIVGGAFGGLIGMVMQAVGSMGNLMKILDPLSTIFEGFTEVMMIVDEVLKPVVQMFKNIGKMIAVIILPILMVVGQVLASFAEGVNSILEPFLALFGVVNDQAEAVEEQNKKLEDLYDKNLKSLQDLYNVGAISGKEYEARLAMMGNRPEGELNASSMVSMSEGMQELLAICKPFFDWVKTFGMGIGEVIKGVLGGVAEYIITGLKSVGNIFGGFGTMIAGLFSGDGNMIAKGFKMILQGLLDLILAPFNLIISAVNGIFDALRTISFSAINIPNLEKLGWTLAVGTANIPHDNIAQVHKGEGIIPATFMESIRKGDLSLSGGGKGSSNVGQPIVVNVYGTVTSERDLVKFIAKELPKASKLGYV